ncbi:GNAT family N-acetyltransferase [Nocardioides sp. CFH 31398]|uniref:GNAT family N-acetyltransferase n=1 Tax=Nocardioides sp. CFH 31398 TaxID=2919579 RepID=UPI001F062C4F|nr:GNAT family N-acetyltransferase [Nocardioides sp. CFH 31398]MCH1866424.1 GNAT family N-acetyltransferase [Nocardioides sp. CFH 31398]
MPHDDATLPGSRDWRSTRTERLLLDAYGPGDLAALAALHADARVWGHYPRGRHTDVSRTAAMAAADAAWWRRDGLAPWSVRLADAGPGSPVVGRVGCSVPDGRPWWNLYYRLAPAVQGSGLAVEAARHALAAAHAVDPDRPVLAFLVEHNAGSRRTAEALGLRLVHRGPDQGNPDPDAVRLVFLDRDPTDAVRAAIDGLRV